ncbi:hypothetical protein FSP39_021342 [Pinctada imbricata]|uniref:Death domain-containing protein n=1 Tax=Pinctada imbricata TaxID=66713 RepID=A0AA88XXB4_PINIB|nr:hypothetical protein FSP39_021342 [Pinctada imbricata]
MKRQSNNTEVFQLCTFMKKIPNQFGKNQYPNSIYQYVTDQFLGSVADDIGSEWYMVCVSLGVKRSHIDHIRGDSGIPDTKAKIHRCLIRWRESSIDKTEESLIQQLHGALIDNSRRDLAEIIISDYSRYKENKERELRENEEETYSIRTNTTVKESEGQVVPSCTNTQAELSSTGKNQYNGTPYERMTKTMKEIKDKQTETTTQLHRNTNDKQTETTTQLHRNTNDKQTETTTQLHRNTNDKQTETTTQLHKNTQDKQTETTTQLQRNTMDKQTETTTQLHRNTMDKQTETTTQLHRNTKDKQTETTTQLHRNTMDKQTETTTQLHRNTKDNRRRQQHSFIETQRTNRRRQQHSFIETRWTT